MGCCSSDRSHANLPMRVGPEQLLRATSLEERSIICLIDGFESEVNQALDDYHFLQENYTKKMDSILETNSLYGLAFEKLKVLQSIQANQIPFQLEKLTELVYLAMNALPKIMRKLKRVKAKLLQQQHHPELQVSDSLTNKICELIFTIDEARIDVLMRQINEWDEVLSSNSTLSYAEMLTKRKIRNTEKHDTILISFSKRFKSMQTIQSRKTITSNSQIFLNANPTNSSYIQDTNIPSS